MAIITAILAGERDPQKLASLKDGRIKASCSDIAAALTGNYRPELLFILSQELQLYESYQAQITAIDAQIEQCLANFAARVDVAAQPLPKPKRRGKKQPGNATQFDLRTYLYRLSGVDFTQVDGIGDLLENSLPITGSERRKVWANLVSGKCPLTRFLPTEAIHPLTALSPTKIQPNFSPIRLLRNEDFIIYTSLIS